MALDITPYLRRAEGVYFDRKSLLEGRPGEKRPRDRRTVRDQIAEYVAGFANNEGGILLLGVEDDGQVTGHRYPAAVINAMLRVPVERLDPPQPAGVVVEVDGRQLLVFEAPMASAPVQVVGDGYPLRMGDRTVQARFEDIQALKLRGLVHSHEAQSSACTLADLDLDSVDAAVMGSGRDGDTIEAWLVQRRLADWRGQALVLRQAAELLFHRGLPEHPNAGIRIFRVVGTERRTGREHNVEELPRIEGALPIVLRTAFSTISGLLRRPTRLAPDGRFKPTSEYPEFAWREAVLNAVGHRDYRMQGRGVEVWLFDDRMEVTSPGGLVPEVSLEQLLTMQRLHFSRNPRIVRALVDLGFMRDQGEGIPRMFAEMEGQFLPLPEVSATPHEVRVVLRNTMTLSLGDRDFLERVADIELSADELRALLEARRHGRVDNARMRSILGLDTLTASKMLRRLRDRGLLTDRERGSATYYQLADQSQELKDESQELASQSQELTAQSQELASQSQELTAQSQELDAAHDVPEWLREQIADLGKRPAAKRIRQVIERLCEVAPRDVATLAAILSRNPEALRRHLNAMVKQGVLHRRYPDRPTHPQQAYQTVQPALETE